MTLEWTLEGTGAVVEKELDEVLGNSKATVKAVQISPISIKVSYDFAPQLIYDVGVDENGKKVEYSDYAEPPKFVGVKMVDGTLYTEINDGGTFGYEDAESSMFTAKVSLRGVINPEEVQSLLFIRDDITQTEEGITEEQCYVVDIK